MRGRVLIKLFILKLFILMNLFSVNLIAENKDLNIALKLNSLKAIKTSEKNDELFFHITEYSTLGRSKETQVPNAPEHWISQKLEGVKNVSLWQGVIKEGESIKLIVSLGEQDLPPWDPNDTLGSAQLNLSNEKGVLKKEWTIPVFEETEEVEMVKSKVKSSDPQHFVFKGSDSNYDAAFQVLQK